MERGKNECDATDDLIIIKIELRFLYADVYTMF
jgi:hypothetical protein